MSEQQLDTQAWINYKNQHYNINNVFIRDLTDKPEPYKTSIFIILYFGFLLSDILCS